MGQVVGYWLAAAAVVAFLLVPGYVLARGLLASMAPLTAMALAPVLAMLFAAATAALNLLLPWSLTGVATVAVALLVTATVVVGWQARRRIQLDRTTLIGVTIWLLSFASVAAFVALPTAVPSDPSLFSVPAERVETPRVPGMPADSHLPYRTGQLALHEIGGEALRDQYHPGWWISDRGPLSGLVFAFGAAVSRVDVPSEDPLLAPADENVMMFTDPYGYWLYLLISTATATASVLGVYALGVRWFGRRNAITGSLLFCLMPGVFIYSIYPRPALVQVLPALLALLLVSERRYWLAGAAIGACYLAHPTGAVWGLAALVVLWLSVRSFRPMVEGGARVAGAAALVALPWMLFTSQVVGGTSRLSMRPLGAPLSDPTQPAAGVAAAWSALLDRGLWEVPWVRAVSVVRSVIPMEALDVPGEVGRAWVGFHSVAAWGLVGLVAFPLAVVAVAKLPRPVRTKVLAVGAAVVGVNILIAGHPETFFYQGLLPLVGLFALGLATWARTWSVGWRLALVVAVVLEFLGLVWASVLFDPFGTPTWIVVVFTSIAAVAQLGLPSGWFAPWSGPHPRRCRCARRQSPPSPPGNLAPTRRREVSHSGERQPV